MLEASGKSLFYAQGLCFSCTRCSACCRHESGFVFLSGKDAVMLIAALKMEYRKFIHAYCRWVPSVNGTEQLSLKEKSNFDCIFWAFSEAAQTGGCSVYEARPLQCRAFPFWPSIVGDKSSWKSAAGECPGMNRGILHSGDTIEKWLAERRKEPIISRNIQSGGDT